MLETRIQKLWNDRDDIASNFTKLDEAQHASQELLSKLNNGTLRVCEKVAGKWRVNEWVKQGILLYFIANDVRVMRGQSGVPHYDKIPQKTERWIETDFVEAGFRMSAGAVLRRGCYISRNCVVMPSFVNIGAYVGEGTLVDAWSTIGSCAQIGRDCHISGGVGIGGVLEPLNAKPVIIEDNVFIGARSEVAEGVIIRKGAVLAMGVYIGASTKILDRQTGKISYGEVPENSVVVPGSVENNGTSLYAAVIVKKVDSSTRKKVQINDILRDAI